VKAAKRVLYVLLALAAVGDAASFVVMPSFGTARGAVVMGALIAGLWWFVARRLGRVAK
jgi:hypothetical protein